MNKISFLFFAVVAALPVCAETLVDRPDVKVGDSWTYQTRNGWTDVKEGTGTSEAVSVGSQTEIVLKSGSGNMIRIIETPDTNTIERVPTKGNAVRYAPDSGRMVFPLQVGKTWVTKNSFTVGESKRGTEDLNATVIGWEEVAVPAGKFTALKIVWNGYYWSTDGAQSGAGRVEATLWYAPEVKRSVKSIYKENDSRGQLSQWTVTSLMAYRVN